MSNHVLPVPVPELVEGELVEGASTSSANGRLVGGEPASDPFAPHGPGRARTEADLHDLAARGAERFADANTAGRDPETVAREVLAWASETFGTSVAAALIAVVLAASATSYNGVQIPSVQGFQMTYILATAVAFVGLVLSIMVPRRSEPVEERHPALPDGV